MAAERDRDGRGATMVERFIAALDAGDPTLVPVAPDAVGWHNTDGVEAPLRTAWDSVRAIRAVVPDFRFDGVRPVAAGTVSFAQYVLRGTMPEGTELQAPACLVVTERDGAIIRSEEYLDATQLAPLVAALTAAAEG